MTHFNWQLLFCYFDKYISEMKERPTSVGINKGIVGIWTLQWRTANATTGKKTHAKGGHMTHSSPAYRGPDPWCVVFFCKGLQTVQGKQAGSFWKTKDSC